MIHTVLKAVTENLNAFLSRKFPEEKGGDIVVLSELMNLDGSVAFDSDTSQNRVFCTLVNVEQERTNLHAPSRSTTLQNPPFNVNLYVLFSAVSAPGNYFVALSFLSATLSFFQGKQVFTPSNTPNLGSAVEKVVVDLVNIDMKDISNLWTALGAKHLPSIMFRIRMLSITAEVILEEITPITGLDTGAKPD